MTTPQERARIEADRVLDKIMDMVDNDGRVSLETLPIIESALQDAERRGREDKLPNPFDILAEVVLRYPGLENCKYEYRVGFMEGFNTAIKEALRNGERK